MSSSADTPAPFLATLSTPTRPLGAALPRQGSPAGTSPWTPKATTDLGTDGRTELDQARAQAMEAGRAKGFAETADARQRLAKALEQVASEHEARASKHAEAIADAATACIEAWLGHADRAEMFGPVIRGWLARSANDPSAVAYVHPEDVGAMRTALGEVKLAVAADPGVARGDVKIRSDVFDLTHQWQERLRQLRDAIASALEKQVSP